MKYLIKTIKKLDIKSSKLVLKDKKIYSSLGQFDIEIKIFNLNKKYKTVIPGFPDVKINIIGKNSY